MKYLLFLLLSCFICSCYQSAKPSLKKLGTAKEIPVKDSFTVRDDTVFYNDGNISGNMHLSKAGAERVAEIISLRPKNVIYPMGINRLLEENPKPKNEKKVLVIGDTGAPGYYHDYSDTWGKTIADLDKASIFHFDIDTDGPDDAGPIIFSYGCGIDLGDNTLRPSGPNLHANKTPSFECPTADHCECCTEWIKQIGQKTVLIYSYKPLLDYYKDSATVTAIKDHVKELQQEIDELLKKAIDCR